MEGFINWFQSHEAQLDTSALGITEYSPSEGGRGAIALKDLPEGHMLFSIPRSLTLSTRTSQLPLLFGLDAWRKAGLRRGWSGLILCMMWEQASGPSSKWQPYLDILPNKFDTPMFWSENDLAELQGTSVVAKLGKAEAEIDYTMKLLPAVKSRPDLFGPEGLSMHYSLDIYHIMGSRILSRSFSMESWNENGDGGDDVYDTGMDSAVKVDQNFEDPDMNHEEEDDGSNRSDDEEDTDNSSDVAMVPMADLLNARYQMANAKLFYEKEVLKMVSMRPIRFGEQIWNTYGDLPNAELLRRYGHVDVLPGRIGNPGDVVEIKADLIVSVIRSDITKDDQIKERIDWWLEQGGEDIFVLDYDFQVPSVMISFTKLFLLSEREWAKVREKSRPPKPKLEGPLYDILILIIERRLEKYPTSLEADRVSLNGPLSLNKRQALIVRAGEKDVLHGCLEKLKGLKDGDNSRAVTEGTRKRKVNSSDSLAKGKRTRH